MAKPAQRRRDRTTKAQAPPAPSYPLNGKYAWLIALSVIVAFAAFLHAQVVPQITDTDSFYHLRHAWEYRTGGLWQSAFPWAQDSAIRTHAADIWYGFHILLVPLTFFHPLLNGIYCGAFFITIVALLLACWAFHRLELKWPVAWTIVFATVTADIMYRFSMLRPHPLSLGLTLLLFSFLVRNPKTIGELWPPFLVAAVFTWTHLALSWILGVVTLAVILPNLLRRRGTGWQSILAVIGGILLGWAARPNPIGAAHLAYIQVVELMLAKQHNIPLGFGRELVPFFWQHFVDQLIPITLLVIVAAALLLSRARQSREVRKPAPIGTWSSLLLAALFFVLTFTVARRSNELFVGFAMIFVGLQCPAGYAYLRRDRRTKILLSVIGLLTAVAVYNVSRFDTYVTHAFDPLLMQPASAWLQEHAHPGEIVFNPNWDRFGELFFWNPSNYYINGMDPIFEYHYNPARYWETHFYAFDMAADYTCATMNCTAADGVATHTALADDFHASYVLLEKSRSPRLAGYLQTAPGFEKVFENPATVVYRIL